MRRPDLRRRLEVARSLNAHFAPVADPEAAAPRSRRDEGEGTGARLLTALAAFDRARSGRAGREVAPLVDRAIGGARSPMAEERRRAALITFILVLADRPEALTICDVALADAHRRGSLFAAARRTSSAATRSPTAATSTRPRSCC